MKTKILVDGVDHHIFKHDGIFEQLPQGVFEFRFHPKTGSPHLERVQEIIMPEKLYSNDKDFIEHVMLSWNSMKRGFLGIALIGGKGLGKTFTTNLLSLATEAPIIKLTKSPPSSDFFQYLNQLNQDIVVHIDEFEKLFPTADDRNKDDGAVTQEQLLSYLDGGSERHNRVMFLITANDPFKISQFMKNRPSRLRYYRDYTHMDLDIIKEIIDDLLLHPEHKVDLLDNITYDNINMDVLIKIIQEINLHNKPYSSFRKFFNFKETDSLKFKIEVLYEDGTKEVLVENYNRAIVKGNTLGRSKIIRYNDTSFSHVSIAYDAEGDNIMSNLARGEVKEFVGRYEIENPNDEDDYIYVPCTVLVSTATKTLSDKEYSLMV